MADPTANLSRGPILLSLSLATASFVFATTFVRFCTRKGIHGGYGADDYTSGAANVIALIGTVFGILESTASDPARALQFNVLGQPWYLVSVTLSKISICLFFMDLLRRARQWRILLAALVVVMAITNLAFALAGYLQCRPLEKMWDPDVPGDCLSGPGTQMSLGYAQGAFSVFSWVFSALFPLLILRDISRDGEPRWPFYVTSVLSLVCGIFVIVRTAQISQTAGVTTYTLHFFYASLMANLEQNLSLTASNLLTLGPLFFSPTRPSFTTAATTTAGRRSRSTSTTTTTLSTDRKANGNKSGRDTYRSSSSSSSFSSSVAGTTSRSASRSGRSGKSTSTSTNRTATTTTTTTASSSPLSRTDSKRSTIVRPGTGSSRSRDDDRHPDRDSSVVAVEQRARKDDLALGFDDDERRRRRRGRRKRQRPDMDGPPGVEGERHLGYVTHKNRGMDDEKAEKERGKGYGYDNDHDEDRGRGVDMDLEAWWPRGGIIKTVEVEVFEELNEEYIAAVAAAAAGDKTGVSTGSNSSSSSIMAMAAGAGRGGVLVPPAAVVVVARQPNPKPILIPRRAVGRDDSYATERESGASGVEQDWEALLRAGPPR